MKEGYKETAVGWIPEEWEVVQQGDVATFYNGRAYSLSEWEDSGTPVIRLQNLTGRGDDCYYSNLQLPEHQYCHKGDLLYMWSASFGAYIWQGEKAIFHYHIWKIECNDEALDKMFLFYLLDDITQRMKNQSHGSTMIHVTKGDMEKLLIQLPPLPEQSKIASILSTVDDKIDSVNKRIEETKKLKQGLMQRLLTQGIGHTKFKDSPLGRIPEEWEVVSLNKIVSQFIVPMRDKPKIFDGDIPWCRIEDFNGIYLSASKSGRHVSQQTIVEMNLKVYPVGTVLVSCSADLGRCAITQNPLTTNQTFIGLVPKSETNGLLLYYKMISAASRLNSLSSGTTISYLSRESFENFVLSFPQSTKEQCEISSILFTVDEKLGILEERNNEYKQLKKGLMQQLLTGKIRVKIENS